MKEDLSQLGISYRALFMLDGVFGVNLIGELFSTAINAVQLKITLFKILSTIISRLVT